jgi:hypothetical protein
MVNKINKPLAKVTKRKISRTKLIKSEIKKEDVTMDNKKIQKIVWEYFENLYSKKL